MGARFNRVQEFRRLTEEVLTVQIFLSQGHSSTPLTRKFHFSKVLGTKVEYRGFRVICKVSVTSAYTDQ